jgi:putative transposase
MARPLRIEYRGALYHVISRGNEQRPIVTDDRDRTRRLDWLRRTVQTYGWNLHAFVLMTNHEHLFVETPEANLSAGMQYLNGSYTSYFNRRWQRSGHLFQGRFKAHLIDVRGYFQAVSRYIHLNPVRVKIISKPQYYPWSSYPGYIRASRALDWITYERVLMDFGPGDVPARRRHYRQYVEAGMEFPAEYPFEDAEGGLVLGSDAFIDRIRNTLSRRGKDPAIRELRYFRARPTLEDIIQVVSRHTDTSPERWRPGCRCDNAGRAIAAFVSRCWYGYSCTEIAEALGYTSISSVSRSVRYVQANLSRLRITLRSFEEKMKTFSRPANH